MTRLPRRRPLAVCVLACLILLGGALAAPAGAAPTSTLTVTLAGTGTGTVTADQPGLVCSGTTCTGAFAPTTSVVLTAVPNPGNGFGGFSGGGCSAATPCTVSLATDVQVTATFDAPPTLTVTAPASVDYAQGSVPAAAFTCPGATCSVVVDGGTPVAAGGALPGAPGSHAFTVTAHAADGGSASQTGTYTVSAPPPAPVITAPANGTAYNANAVPKAAFTCGHDPNSALASCTATVDGTTAVASGAALPAGAGPHTLTVTGTDADGLSTHAGATYTVNPPPTCRDLAATTNEGAAVSVTLACADPNASVSYRIDARPRHGTIARSGRVVTYTPAAGFAGSDSFTYHGVSANGASATHTVSIVVLAPPAAHTGTAPQVVITAPVDNAAYPWTAVPAADFVCLAGAGSSVQSCRATVDGHAISDHQPLPNAFGVHTLTVTATDADGLGATASATYTITSSANLAPPVSITAPVQGAAYRLGQRVRARYSCLAPTSGPALKSCVGTVRAGHPINTRTLGTHTFSVSATNDQGASTTETVSYTVIPTSNRFIVTAVRAGRSGVARLRLRLPGPGVVKVAATAWNAARGASRHRIVYGLARIGARRAGPVHIVITPSAAGRALLRVRRARPVISLVVSYAPTGARPRAVRLKPLRLR